MKRKLLHTFTLAVLFTFSVLLTGCSGQGAGTLHKLSGYLLHPSNLSSPEDINLRSDDGWSYYFTYKDEDYYAEYSSDTWKIYNSYRIKSPRDILLICKALDAEHRVPSRDYESFRTPADMAFEWEQHNIAYEQLPEDNSWRANAKNVDLDPEDQGKTFKDIYEERTGNKIDLEKIMENKGRIKEKLKEKLKEVLEDQ